MPLPQFLDKCRSLRILVIGDLMMDRYLWGKVNRISPEAPVPIVDIHKEENRLGGAANVALNLHSMGAKPVLCGWIGKDDAGTQLLSLAESQGFDTQFILPHQKRRTTVKIRVIGNGQQVLRVDKEDNWPMTSEESQEIGKILQNRLEGFDAIVFQDYDKGALSPAFIQQVIEEGNSLGIPILVDPKFRHFWEFSGSTLFKPNLKELNEGGGHRLRGDDLPGLLSAVTRLREKMPHSLTLITLSEKGMLLVDESQQPHLIPAQQRNIADVSGAGDTVIGMVSLGLAAGLSPYEAAYYANVAGGLVCESVGVVPIDPQRFHTAIKEDS